MNSNNHRRRIGMPTDPYHIPDDDEIDSEIAQALASATNDRQRLGIGRPQYR